MSALRAFLMRDAGPPPMKVWGWCAVALAVVVLVVIIAGAVAASQAGGQVGGQVAGQESNAVAWPETLHLTWQDSAGATQFPVYVKATAKYVLGAGTSLAAFKAAIGTALDTETSQVLCFYEYAAGAKLTTDQDRLATVFVKYIDANKANRFAFFAVINSALYKIYTTDDVGTMTDPTEYTGAWSFAYNGAARTTVNKIHFS